MFWRIELSSSSSVFLAGWSPFGHQTKKALGGSNPIQNIAIVFQEVGWCRKRDSNHRSNHYELAPKTQASALDGAHPSAKCLLFSGLQRLFALRRFQRLPTCPLLIPYFFCPAGFPRRVWKKIEVCLSV